MQDQAPALCYRMRSTIEAFPALRRVLLFVVIALCSSAVARAEYYPLRLGYEAVYRGTALGQPATITRMMPERAEVYGIPCLVEYTISESALGTFVWRAYLAYLEGDLCILKACEPGGACRTYGPWGDAVALPAGALYTGQTWHYYAPSDSQVDRTVLLTNTTVTTQQNTYTGGVLIEEHIDNSVLRYAWLADGPGIVKIAETGADYALTAELTSLTLPEPTPPTVTFWDGWGHVLPSAEVSSEPPADIVVTDEPSISIYGTAYCDSPVSTVAWTNSRGGSGTCSGTTNWDTGTVALQPGENTVSITATNSHGQTGTAAVTVSYVPNTAPQNVSVTPSSGLVRAGQKTTFKTVYSDANGYGTIASATFLLSESSPPDYGADVTYTRAENKLYLYDHDSESWKGGYAPGTAQVIENDYCRLYCSETTVEHSENTLTVNWRLELKPVLAGKKLRQWMYVSDSGDLNTGWVQMGEITVPIPNRPPVNVSVAPASGSLATGTPQTFFSQYTDPEGTGDIKGAYLLLNTTLTGANGVYLWLDARANKLWLGDDAGKAWLGGYEPGSANVIENKTCKLYCSDTTVVSENNTLKVNWRVELKPPAGGKALKEWMYVLDMSGLSDGWESLGTVQVQATDKPPVNTGVTPSSGAVSTGAATTLTSQYSDPNGAASLKGAYLLLNESLSGANAVYLWYDCTAKKLYLRDSANRAWLGPVSPGAVNTLENNACKLYCGDTTVAANNETLTVNWRVELKPSAGGRTLNEWMYVLDTSGLSDGWESLGTISVPVPNKPPVNTSVTPSSGTVSTGQAITYTTRHSDPDGATTLKGAYLLLDETLDGADAVYLWYDCAANRIYLRDSANKAWSAGVAPGVGVALENNTCRVYCAETSVVREGETLSVNWRIELKSSTMGRNLKAWMYTVDNSGRTDGWEQVSTFTIGSSEINISVSPIDATMATGSTTTLTTHCLAPSGKTATSTYLLLNSIIDPRDGVYLYYDGATNRMFLRNDAGTAWDGGCAPGSANAISNRLVTVNCADSVATMVGDQLEVQWSIHLTPAADGRRFNVWMYTMDTFGRTDGWDQMGFLWILEQPPDPVFRFALQL